MWREWSAEVGETPSVLDVCRCQVKEGGVEEEGGKGHGGFDFLEGGGEG